MTALYVVLVVQLAVLVYAFAAVQEARRARDRARYDRRLVQQMLDEAALDGALDADDVIGIASTPSGEGYWLLTAGGEVWWYGDAAWYGDPDNDGLRLNAPVTGIAADPEGRGYWIVAADGGVFTYGPGLGFHGSGPQDDLDEDEEEDDGDAVTLTDAHRSAGYSVTADGTVRWDHPDDTRAGTLIIDPDLTDVTILWSVDDDGTVHRGGIWRSGGHAELVRALIDHVLGGRVANVYVDPTGAGLAVLESLAASPELAAAGVRVDRSAFYLPLEFLPSTS